MTRRFAIPVLFVLLLLAACAPATVSPTGAPATEATEQPTESPTEITSTPTPSGQEQPGGEARGEQAEDESKEEDTDEDEAAYCAAAVAKQHPVALKLADQFDVTYDEIMGWFCQGYGFGDIKHAYQIAAASGQPVDQIFALFDSGLGWGEVKQQLGLGPGNAGDEDEDVAAYCADPTLQHPALLRLADRFEVTYEEVLGWFCQGWGVGEIKIAYEIAAASGQPVAEIFAMAESGLGWGEIKQQLGVKIGGPPDDKGKGKGAGDDEEDDD